MVRIVVNYANIPEIYICCCQDFVRLRKLLLHLLRHMKTVHKLILTALNVGPLNAVQQLYLWLR